MSAIDEIALIVGSGAVGLAAGSLAIYIYQKQKKIAANAEKSSEDSVTKKDSAAVAGKAAPTAIQDIIDEKSGHRIIPKSELEKSRKELKTLQLEKELSSGALTRLYEAEAAREITREEREILASKYRGELQSIDDRIQKIDALVQIGDLETLRDQLLRLVSQKIEAIEVRLERTQIIAAPLIAELKNSVPKAAKNKETARENTAERSPIPDISDLLTEAKQSDVNARSIGANSYLEVQDERVESRPTTSSETAEGKQMIAREARPLATERRKPGSVSAAALRAEELHKDILEALDRLEKLDIEG